MAAERVCTRVQKHLIKNGILGGDTPPGYFGAKSPQATENKGWSSRKVDKSPQISEDNEDIGERRFHEGEFAVSHS